jgi:Ca2+-binding RTX toxin-like protein
VGPRPHPPVRGARSRASGSANDILEAGEGNDFATDAVLGEGGNDDLFGGPTDDVVNCGNGDDNLTGNFGNDTPLGGKGDDTLFGDAFFDDPGAFDLCNGQQGFDLSATCEVDNQIEGDLPPE